MLAGGGRMTRTHEQRAVVEQIYAAAEDHGDSVLSAWPALMESLSAWLHADKANSFLLGPGAQLLETRTWNVDDTTQRLYHEHYHRIDPRFEAAGATPNVVFIDTRVLQRRAFEQTEIYNDYLRPRGVEYSMFVNLEYAPGHLAPQAFFRSKGMGGFSAGDAERFDALLPHLSRTLRLRTMMLEARLARGDLQRVVDAMSVPVAVFDATGAVVCVGRRARAALAQLPSLSLRGGRLSSADQALDAELRLAEFDVLRLVAGAELAPKGPEVVLVARHQRQSAALLFFPLLPGSSLRDETGSAVRFLVAIHDPELAEVIDTRVVQRLYGLTRTEADLAVALAAGQSVLQFASVRGCSEQTVRVHLKRVLEKTKTARQADLVRVLLAGGALQFAP